LDITVVIRFVAGILVLIAGAEWLVRGASRLASALGMTPLVIGITVVAFGTSAPEFAVCVLSALSGKGDIALGNVVGSNIFNILFILGISALIVPHRVNRQLVYWDIPVMIGVSGVLYLLAADGKLGHPEAILFLAGIALYIAWSILRGRRREESPIPQNIPVPSKGGGTAEKKYVLAFNGLLVLGGLTLLVLGARWLVSASATIARAAGLSELIIGLTIVSVGTSLPEVAASIVAAIRGERDIAVGNIVGSNLLNLLGVLGLSVAVSPSGIPVASAALAFDIPVMFAVALICLPILFTRHKIARWEGALFLFYYTTYILYLILDAKEHDALPQYSKTMLFFVIPITIVVISIVAMSQLRRMRSLIRKKGG
jgi:cation:H+ antiporter